MGKHEVHLPLIYNYESEGQPDVFGLSPGHPPPALVQDIEVFQRLKRGRGSSGSELNRKFVVPVQSEGKVDPGRRTRSELRVSDAVPIKPPEMFISFITILSIDSK